MLSSLSADCTILSLSGFVLPAAKAMPLGVTEFDIGSLSGPRTAEIGGSFAATARASLSASAWATGLPSALIPTSLAAAEDGLVAKKPPIPAHA